MEPSEPNHERGRGRRPRSPVYYVQILRQRDADAAWVTVDVAEDKREAAQLAAAAVRRHDDPGRVRVMPSAELLRTGGQDAINRAARDLWAGNGRTGESGR
jgi:hypothetical protein